MVSIVLAVLGVAPSDPPPFSLLPVPDGQVHNSPLLLKLHDFDMFSYFNLKLPGRELEDFRSPRLLKLRFVLDMVRKAVGWVVWLVLSTSLLCLTYWTLNRSPCSSYWPIYADSACLSSWIASRWAASGPTLR